MTTVSTQQILDFVLEQISKDFNLDIIVLKNKYSSIDDMSKAIELANIPKKKVVRKVIKSVAFVEEPVVALEVPIKKKVVRKITKPVAAEEEPLAAKEEPLAAEEEPLAAKEEPLATKEEPLAAKEEPLATKEEPTKKKVIRKVTKSVAVNEEPVAVNEEPVAAKEEPLAAKEEPLAAKEEPLAAKEEPLAEVLPELPSKKKVVRKVTKPLAAVEEPVVEEKVKPKRIVKKNPTQLEDTSVITKKSKKNLDLVEFNTDVNSIEGVDEIETGIYTDANLYNDEDSDSLEPREINGVKYYIDTSNYLYNMDNQDLIGKFNENTNTIVILSDFPSEK